MTGLFRSKQGDTDVAYIECPADVRWAWLTREVYSANGYYPEFDALPFRWPPSSERD